MFLISFLLIISCSPSSSQDFTFESEQVLKELLHDLQKIQSKEDILKRRYRLKKKFNQVADLMILAYQKGGGLNERGVEESKLNDLLLQEINRIYQIEEGRLCMEKLQSEALARIDAFYRKVRK